MSTRDLQEWLGGRQQSRAVSVKRDIVFLSIKRVALKEFSTRCTLIVRRHWIELNGVRFSLHDDRKRTNARRVWRNETKRKGRITYTISRLIEDRSLNDLWVSVQTNGMERLPVASASGLGCSDFKFPHIKLVEFERDALHSARRDETRRGLENSHSLRLKDWTGLFWRERVQYCILLERRVCCGPSFVQITWEWTTGDYQNAIEWGIDLVFCSSERIGTRGLGGRESAWA